LTSLEFFYLLITINSEIFEQMFYNWQAMKWGSFKTALVIFCQTQSESTNSH